MASTTEPQHIETRALCARVDGLYLNTTDHGDSLDIKTPAVRARVALQGAQVLSWQPAGHRDVLWCSTVATTAPGSAIRGGIPVCWPWFSRHPTDPKLPQHGFARNTLWQLTAAERIDDAITLTFSLPAAAHRNVATSVSARLTLHLGAVFTAELETHNHGPAAFTLTTALHTYFAVSDAANITIDGLHGADYRDLGDAGRSKTQSGVLRIAAETTALFDRAPALATLTDPGFHRRIDITRIGGVSTVVWNPGATARTFADIPPGAEKNFVCVESGVIGAAATTLAPGDRHTVGVHYRVTDLTSPPTA